MSDKKMSDKNHKNSTHTKININTTYQQFILLLTLIFGT